MRGGTREDPIHYHSPRKASPPGCEMEDLVQGALLCSAFLAQDLLQFTTRIRDLLNTRPVSSDRKMRTP